MFKECGERGMQLAAWSILGGGFPTKYLKNVPSVKTYGTAIFKALRKPPSATAPRRLLSSRAAAWSAMPAPIEAEVVLVSKKSEEG